MREIIGRTGRQNWWDNWTELTSIFLAHVEGDLAAARATVSLHESVRGRRWMALVDGELSFEAGELELAEELLAFARATPRSGPGGATDRGFSLGLAARVAARRGDPEGAADLISQLAATIEVLPKERQITFSDTWHGALVAACQSGMSLEQVRDLERLLGTRPEPTGHQGDPGWPPHLQGAMAELAGDLDEAIVQYTAAATQTGWRRSVPAKADALMGLARSQLLAGDHEAAKRSAGQALNLLDRWTGWRREEAKALVRRLQGAGSPSRDGDLTPREREVAALVAEGLSNGEIGKRLYISTKTASVHVSSILRKLAMSNRSEIAAWAVRTGIGGPPTR
jgi:DNA-binding CsgD family transcriptional regulator